jgi:hypothetical protein
MSDKQVRAQYTREFKQEAVRVRRLRWWPHKFDTSCT